MSTYSTNGAGNAGGDVDYLFSGNGVVKHRPGHHSYRRRGRHRRNGHCAAALRAFTGARLFLQEAVPSLIAAADACGSNPRYVKAMVVLIRSENTSLRHDVLRGNVPLLMAARQMQRIADLVTAYRAAATVPKDLATAGEIVGVANLWDTMIVPTL